MQSAIWVDEIIGVITPTKKINKKVVYFRATWHTFQPKPPKIKKKLPRKKVLIFQEMELSGSKIKKFIVFSQKRTPPPPPCFPLHFSAQARKKKKSTPQKIPYISGNGTS